ncbi:MAG: hypothetical protein K6U12_05960 [Armatimonadetes bacterium]|nr:hypothetical protein [Armatimonadota bacterium]CUU34824.1 hypothetical protein DCOP10_11140 [Armatimonadetes bacterium DC]
MKADIEERVARLEQELGVVKQQLRALMTQQPPTEALQKLAELWGLEASEPSPLPLPEARERLARGLPPNWGSRLIKRQRRRR